VVIVACRSANVRRREKRTIPWHDECAVRDNYVCGGDEEHSVHECDCDQHQERFRLQRTSETGDVSGHVRIDSVSGAYESTTRRISWRRMSTSTRRRSRMISTRSFFCINRMWCLQGRGFRRRPVGRGLEIERREYIGFLLPSAWRKEDNQKRACRRRRFPVVVQM
jgi:hypothetical protein